MQDIKSFDLSVEEFDAIQADHIFSDRYNKRKAAILKDYRKRQLIGQKGTAIKVAAATLIVLTAVPISVNAAMNGELFQRIWGNLDRKNIDSHVETMIEDSKGTEISTTFPKVEFEEIDETKAIELIGQNVSFPSIRETMGDTTIELLSVVHDGNAIVAEYTLERAGGVNCFDYGQLRNETKGALLKEDVPYRFHFLEGSGKIYVDLSRSTDEKLYCYEYMADESSMLGSFAGEAGFSPITDHVTLCIEEFSAPVSSFINDDGGYESHLTDSREISVPVKEKIAVTSLKNAEGRILEISPISLRTPAAYVGNTVFEDELRIYHVSIQYQDGTEYLVLDENIPYEAALANRCSVETANYQYFVGGIDGDFIILFNRLVDVCAVKSVTINDVTYSIK